MTVVVPVSVTITASVTVTVAVPASASIPVIPLFPGVVVEFPSAEITSVVSMEPVTVVFVIPTILIMTAPGGIGVVGVAGEVPFEYAKLRFYTDLGISGVRYQASGYDQGGDE